MSCGTTLLLLQLNTPFDRLDPDMKMASLSTQWSREMNTETITNQRKKKLSG